MDCHYTIMSEDERKLYTSIENMVNYINSKFIALSKEEKRRNNIILNVISNQIIQRMKQTNPLLGALFKTMYYGGSYYDQLKVGSPNEYDLDLILSLPQVVNPVLKCSDRPGFVMIEVKDYEKIFQRPPEEQARFKELECLLASNVFLSTTKVQSWFEGIFNKVCNTFPKEGKSFYLEASLTPQKPEEVIKIYIRIIKGGPAITLKITGKEIDGSDFQLDIDLVPCFQFDGNQHWPEKCRGYRTNPCSGKPSFLVVPKKPRYEVKDKSLLERYWRLSFQEQERELIGNDKKTLKPSLKILKKLRDRCDHNIPSYFIKTIYLWTVDEGDVTFWCQPVSFVIITMLKKYEQHLRERKISYYWNENYNLIEYMSESTTQGIANRLNKIISEVKIGLMDPIDPYVIGKSLLTTQQFERLKLEVPLSKKQEKKIQMSKTNKKLNTSHSFIDSPDSAPSRDVLEFSSSDLIDICQLVNAKRQKSCCEQMANKPERTQETSEGNEVVAYLKKIDEKLDKVLDRFEEILKERQIMSFELKNLEERMTALEINNESLKAQVSVSGSIEE